MNVDDRQHQVFIDELDKIASSVSGYSIERIDDKITSLKKNFQAKINDFYDENRKLNIGVIGQVKAGKSSFLNTLLFDGNEILPKASTPKTATLTKMEYSENNIIEIEYYEPDEWMVIEENSELDIDEEIYTSARELVNMARKNGINPMQYSEKGKEILEFATYEELISRLNDYVGENGRFTPIVKSVTLYLNKEEFKGLSIIDTPGLNDPIASRSLRTKDFMEVCDVVFFLSQSGSFLDKSDWELLSSQLPQKGVKKLVLIASKYDSGIRDVLKKTVQDNPFRKKSDDSFVDNIPDACKLIAAKLKERAKLKVEEFVNDLTRYGSEPELIEVIKQCSEPILVSAMVYNMSNKPESEYNSEELNVFNALKKYSSNIVEDMRLLGNIDEVRQIFNGVVEEKESLLVEKSKSFIPNALAELRMILTASIEKAERKMTVLKKNDKESLDAQRIAIEKQISNIKADIGSLFADLQTTVETEKGKAVRDLSRMSKDFTSVREHSGTITRIGSYTTGHLWWKKKHTYPYEEHYSYFIAADAVDNLRKYSMEATNHIAEVFTESIQLKDLKRRLLNIVVDNFDMGSEKYDSSFFKRIVDETVTSIELPVFRIDCGDIISKISSQFTGELTSSSDKNALVDALGNALDKINGIVVDRLVDGVRKFKEELKETSEGVQSKLLENINKEFDELLAQCECKEKEIAEYNRYIEVLGNELAKL